MEEERRLLLLGVLHRALGEGNPRAEEFLDLAVKIRSLMETGSLQELQFLHGMLDGALAQLPEFVNKKLHEDKASGK